jgi:hypothetical protein
MPALAEPPPQNSGMVYQLGRLKDTFLYAFAGLHMAEFVIANVFLLNYILRPYYLERAFTYRIFIELFLLPSSYI